jgi:HEAT repeat protein
MSSRVYVIAGVILVVVLGAVFAAHYQRARKTAELLEDLDTDKTDVAMDTMQELVKRGGAVEDALIEKLDSSRRRERMRAAVLLGEVGTRKCGPALVGRLRDEWLPVRRAAVCALGQVRYGEAYWELLKVANDDEAEMDTRCLAVQSLALLCMGDLSPKGREACATAMLPILARRPAVKPEKTEDEQKAEDEAKKAEEKALKAQGYEPIPAEADPADKEVELRKEAVLLLALTGVRGTVPAVVDSLAAAKEPSAVVRQHAAMALGDLPDVPSDQQEASQMGRGLLLALEDKDATVRMFAARALARHPSFGLEGLDDGTDAKLVEMAAELTEDGESGYWVREAARSACDARGVTYEQPKATGEADEQSAVKTALAGSAATGGH